MKRRTFLRTLALGIPSSVALASCETFLPGVGVSPCRWECAGDRRRIAVVGDLQRAMSTLPALLASTGVAFNSYGTNDTERGAILAGIANHRPDMLLLLGDQVEDGDDAEDWDFFDQAMRPVREANVQTWAVLGNHDYGSMRRRENRQPWRRHFLQRFPHQEILPLTTIQLNDYSLVVVDSNLPTMTDAAIAKLALDFRVTLAELDNSDNVAGVIVAMHHPPYTNGGFGFGPMRTVGSMMERLQTLFAEPFLLARKTRLFLSGHTHSYQRFIVDSGKQFVVSGGGGGPRHSVDIGADRLFTNDADVLRTVAERPFHFLMLELDAKGISLQVHMLDQSTGLTYIGDGVTQIGKRP